MYTKKLPSTFDKRQKCKQSAKKAIEHQYLWAQTYIDEKKSICYYKKMQFSVNKNRNFGYAFIVNCKRHIYSTARF